jgi:hypothetical protein
MRISVLAVLTSAAIGAAGCSGTSTPTPSPSTPPATSAAAGSVASCMVGTWQSTAVQGGFGVTGGAGVRMTITAAGDTTTDFTSMQPIMFAVKIAERDVKGRFTYGGQVNGKMRTASPTATSGTWEPAGPIDWSQVKVTLELTDPVQSKPLDNLPIKDYLGEKSSQTGGVVDIDPMLGSGSYTCEGTATLILTPKDQNGLKWTLTRKP